MAAHSARKRTAAQTRWHAYARGRERYRHQAAYQAGYAQAQRLHGFLARCRRMGLVTLLSAWAAAALAWWWNPARFHDWPLLENSLTLLGCVLAAAAVWRVLNGPRNTTVQRRTLQAMAAVAVVTVFLLAAGVLPALAVLVFVFAPALALAGALLYADHQTRAIQTAHRRARNAHALTCKRCGKQALPVEGTRRWYACRCGNRFTTRASHGF